MSAPEISIELAADPRLLRGVRGLVEWYLSDVGLDGDRAKEVVLGVDEACTNAIRHSCGDPGDTFSLSLSCVEEWIEIRIEDSGECPPPEVFDKGLPSPSQIEDATPGGLGIGLIREIFDEVEFCGGEVRGNCVTMKIRRPGHGG